MQVETTVPEKKPVYICTLDLHFPDVYNTLKVMNCDKTIKGGLGHGNISHNNFVECPLCTDHWNMYFVYCNSYRNTKKHYFV